MRDVSAERLAEVRSATNFTGSNQTSWTRKPADAPLTKTEAAMLESIPVNGLELGFVSRALLYAPAVRQFSKPQRAALYSLIDRGKLRVMRQYSPDREIIIPAPSVPYIETDIETAYGSTVRLSRSVRVF